MAILHFLLSLARKEDRRLAVNITAVFNLLFLVMALFAVAFQCRLPQPWLTISRKCFDQVSSNEPRRLNLWLTVT